MKYISVIDIGSSKVMCTTVSPNSDGAIVVHGVGICEYPGYRLGSLPSQVAIAEALATAIELSEAESGIRVRNACIGVPAPFTKTIVTPCQIEAEYGIAYISQEDIDYLVDSSADTPPTGFELMHSTPFCFSIDGNKQTESPVGEMAHLLAAKVSHAFVDSSFRNMVSDCLKEIGVTADPFISSAMANALFAIPYEQRQNGAILIDCGGSHCDIAYIREDAVTSSISIGIGGNHITNDIALGLRLPHSGAEELKHKFDFSPAIDDSSIRIRIPYEGLVSVKRSVVRTIIEARVDELGEYLFKALCDLVPQLSPDIPIHMTGNGIAGIRSGSNYLSDCIGRTIIVNAPRTSRMSSGSFSTSFALAQFMLYGSGISVKVPNRFVKSIKDFILTKL